MRRESSRCIPVLIVLLIVLSPLISDCKGKDEVPLGGQAGKEPDPLTFILEAEQAFGNYVVRIYVQEANLADGFVEILKDGHRVYREEGFRFHIGSAYEEEKKSTLIPMGRDITGDGEPDLVVSEWSGGGHCCFTFRVFQIGKEFRKIATIDAGHGERADFADLDGDSTLEFVMNDWTFAYWRTSFGDSPAPKVILRYRDGAYRLAPDLMRANPPSSMQLDTLAKEVRGHEDWKGGEPPGGLWGVMLDLIYTGHANMAWSFFDKAWPPGAPGKAELLQEFRDKLSHSPYWGELRALLGN